MKRKNKYQAIFFHLNWLNRVTIKKLVRRQSKGKVAFIFPTPRGLDIRGKVAQAYKNLYLKYGEYNPM